MSFQHSKTIHGIETSGGSGLSLLSTLQSSSSSSSSSRSRSHRTTTIEGELKNVGGGRASNKPNELKNDNLLDGDCEQRVKSDGGGKASRKRKEEVKNVDDSNPAPKKPKKTVGEGVLKPVSNHVQYISVVILISPLTVLLLFGSVWMQALRMIEKTMPTIMMETDHTFP